MKHRWESLACLAALISGASFAEGGVDLEQGLQCMAQGYDVIVTNDSDGPLAAGSIVGWSVAFARMSGTEQVARDIPVGDRLFLVAVLGSNYLAGNGTPCEAEIVKTER